MSAATIPERPKDVDGTAIDPDADSLDALKHHAARRLRRLRTQERATFDTLRLIQEQMNRERTVLMLNGADPDAEARDAHRQIRGAP